jgi:hypothetical protein
MKKLLLLILAGFIQLNISSQVANWAPLSTGLNGDARCMIVFNNKLIVGGSFNSAGGNLANNIAAWDGSNWSILGSGLIGGYVNSGSTCTSTNYGSGSVETLEIYNNELYAGGTFSVAGGVPSKNIAKWNGTTWSPVGGGVKDNYSSAYGTVYCLKVYNNELYVGGRIDSAGNIKVKNIAKWNGATWSNVAGGTNLSTLSTIRKVRAMDTLNNNLYVAGIFDTIGGIPANSIAKWDGFNWAPLGAGFNLGSAPLYGVTLLSKYNNMLYAGNPNTGISKWNGTNWAAVGGGIGVNGNIGGNSQAWAATKFGNDLIVGGNFGNSGALLNTFGISKWNDTNWDYMGIPLVSGTTTTAGFNVACVKTLAVYNNELYAGGGFSKELLQNTNLNHVARFLNVVGINEISALQNHVSVYPNPSTSQFNFNGLVGENTIQITDIMGRALHTEKTYTENHTLKLDAAQGIYFYKITDKKNRVQQGKLILN